MVTVMYNFSFNIINESVTWPLRDSPANADVFPAITGSAEPVTKKKY